MGTFGFWRTSSSRSAKARTADSVAMTLATRHDSSSGIRLAHRPSMAMSQAPLQVAHLFCHLHRTVPDLGHVSRNHHVTDAKRIARLGTLQYPSANHVDSKISANR